MSWACNRDPNGQGERCVCARGECLFDGDKEGMMAQRINTVRLTNDQAHVIQVSLDNYGDKNEGPVAKAWRTHVHCRTMIHDANGETFDIVPKAPPLKAHNLKTQMGARIEAAVDDAGSRASYKVNCDGWYFRAGDCDEAAEFFQRLARELRERE